MGNKKMVVEIPYYDLNNELDKILQAKITLPAHLPKAKLILESIEAIKNTIDKDVIKENRIITLKKYIEEFDLKNARREEKKVEKESEFLSAKLRDQAQQEKENLTILRNPKLIKTIMKELDKKIKGESDSKLFIFISACNIYVKNSQKRLHTLIISASSAGKSHITKETFSIFPKERFVYQSRISATALSYLKANEPNWTWDGIILYLEDIEEKVLNCDVLKVFLSEGLEQTTITIKPGVTQTFKVQGQPVVFTTTASSEPSPEQVNRFNQISLNESIEQTIEINLFTAEAYKTGKKIVYDPAITEALRSLDRVKVLVPFADKIGLLFPGKNVKARRDFPRFLELIMCSTALHQYQRESNEKGYLLAEKFDYEVAIKCLNKLRLSETMTSLTPTEEKMLEVCKDLTEKSEIVTSNETEGEIQQGFTTLEAITKHPIISKTHWYNILSKFVVEGLIVVELLKTEDSKQKVKHFKYKTSFEGFSLPEFEVLCG